MNSFFLDKQNKVPLYIQLKDQIKYYVSTGAIRSQEQLPPVKVLAKSLGINFFTVRKAYKDLEQEGLVTIRHGDGCYITLHKGGPRGSFPAFISSRPTSETKDSADGSQILDEAKKLFMAFLTKGMTKDEIKQDVEKALSEFERDLSAPTIVFTECNRFQVEQISILLEKSLGLKVRPVMIDDLALELPGLSENGKEVNVITTGFHVNQVRQAVGDLPAQIDVLITNLNPETRRQLENVSEQGKFGFICRDSESAILYKDLLKAELGFEQINLISCTLAETEKVQDILNSADVVLSSPPVFEEVKELAAGRRPVFNLFDRVDPMSLKVIRDRILGGGDSPIR